MKPSKWYKKALKWPAGYTSKRSPLQKDLEIELEEAHVSGFQLSPLCSLKEIIVPLYGWNFRAQCGNYRSGIRAPDMYRIVCSSLREAVWAYELMVVISKRPRSFFELQQSGNYHALMHLKGNFSFFSDRLDYFIHLNRWVYYFLWQSTNKIKWDLPGDNILERAIETLASIDLEEIANRVKKTKAITGENAIIRSQLLKSFKKHKFQLRAMEPSVQKMFLDHPPNLSLPELGLIHEDKLSATDF
jgi:hypothetical protein